MEAISPYYVKPMHGTALKAVIEEGALMDQFMTMFKKNLKNLIELRDSWNAKWSEGGVGSLLSPLLTHFEDEIKHLTQARENIDELWKEPPVPQTFEAEKETDFDPFEMPKTLERLFTQCKESHDVVSTSAWKEQLGDWYHTNHLAGPLPGMRFPQIDRMYRTHVVTQQRYVEKARKWYNNDMEAIIERHQQYAEDIQKLSRGFLGALNDLKSQSLISCSSAVHSIISFSSSQFIAARHEEFEQERDHVILQPFDYHSYYRTDQGEIARPVFGLGTEHMVELVELILDSTKVEWETWPHCMKWLDQHSGIDHMLRLECRFVQKSDMKELLKEEHDKWPGYVILYIQYALWSGSPLILISDEQVAQYESPVKRPFSFDLRRSSDILLRRRMEPITKLVDYVVPSQVAQLASRLLAGIMSTNHAPTTKDPLAYASSILTHSKGSQAVIKDIWQKWDLIHGRPLTFERNFYSDGKPTMIQTSFQDTIKNKMMVGQEQLHPNESTGSHIGGLVDWRYRIGRIVKEAKYLLNPENMDIPIHDWIIYRMDFEGVDMVTDNRIMLKMMHLHRSDRSHDSSDLQPLTMSELESCTLEKEQEAYSSLSLIDNVPRVYYSGKYRITRCLVIDHCGSDLGSLFQKCSYQISVKTVAMIAKQTISMVEAIHRENVVISHITLRNLFFREKEDGKGVIHISNFVLGGEKSLRFIYPHPLIIGSPSTDTKPHAIAQGVRLHRQMIDDLEALGYMFLYFLRGGLPQHFPRAVGQKSLHKLMTQIKETLTVRSLAQGCPDQFLKYINYLRNCDINQLPNYQYLRNFFQDVLEDIGETDDGMFDWDTSEGSDSANKVTKQSSD